MKVPSFKSQVSRTSSAAGPGEWRRAAVFLLLATCFLSLATGCGFRLRGAVVLPEAMQETHLTGVSQHSPLGREINQALSGAGGRLVGKEAASAVLTILNEDYNRRVLSVGSDRRAREYSLNYSLQFALYAPDGSVLVSPQTVNASREYRFDRANVLSSGGEEDVLKKEMREYGVRQMFRQLQALMRTRESGGGGQ